MEVVGAHGEIRTREGGGISRDQGDPTKLETLVSHSLVEQEHQQTFSSDLKATWPRRTRTGPVGEEVWEVTTSVCGRSLVLFTPCLVCRCVNDYTKDSGGFL